MAHGNLHRGASQLEDPGFSPEEAVAAATSQAARVCGLKHRKVLLRKGHDVDLIVVDGDLQVDLLPSNGCAWSRSLGNRSANGCHLHLVSVEWPGRARPVQCHHPGLAGPRTAVPMAITISMLIELACT